MVYGERQKMQKNMVERLHEAEESQNEICVICGVLTNVPKDRDLMFRKHYIDGVGQLCNLCAEEYQTEEIRRD